MTTQKSKIKSYSGEEKNVVRSKVLETINEYYKKDSTTAYLDLYGAGESFKYIKGLTKARILSIDSDPNIGKKMKGIEGTRSISIKDLCLEDNTEKFNIIWLDYCCTLTDDVLRDLNLLARKMKQKGTLYITLSMRDVLMPKGTKREWIEYALTGAIHKTFMDNFIEVKREYTAKYNSSVENNKKAATVMKLYKFTWKTVKEQTNSIPYPTDDLRLVTEL